MACLPKNALRREKEREMSIIPWLLYAIVAVCFVNVIGYTSLLIVEPGERARLPIIVAPFLLVYNRFVTDDSVVPRRLIRWAILSVVSTGVLLALAMYFFPN